MDEGKFEYIIKDHDKELPIKELLKRNFGFSSRLMRKLKANGCVQLNGSFVKMHQKGNPGDRVSVFLPRENSSFEPEKIPISVIYEDDDLLIINKQPGYVVHPTKGHPCHTMANGVMNYMLENNKNFKIRFVNRLDMDTSGLLAVAKNSHCQDDLQNQMLANGVVKKYLAVVKGIVREEEGTVDLPIGLEQEDKVRRAVVKGGFPSVTHYRVLERFERTSRFERRRRSTVLGFRQVNCRNPKPFVQRPFGTPTRFARCCPFCQPSELGAKRQRYKCRAIRRRRIAHDHSNRVSRFEVGYTLLEIILETGRTHQIRVHMSHIGHPIIGDVLYGENSVWLIERQALHAGFLSFRHPVTGQFMELEAPLPEDMCLLLEKIK